MPFLFYIIGYILILSFGLLLMFLLFITYFVRNIVNIFVFIVVVVLDSHVAVLLILWLTIRLL
jgi:hypothetical protein